MSNKSLVIIPTYNEKENIEDIINAVFSLETEFHVLIVDDGSPDGTGSIVKDLQLKNSNKLHLIERKGKLGLGTAYIAGFKFALKKDYDYIFEMDADFSHPPKDLENLLIATQSNDFDMAVGSRYVNGKINVVNWDISRVMLSFFASKYVKMITGMPIADATAGFKCYSRIVLETIDLEKVKFVGYAFQIEMKFTAWKFGFRIKEVPIIFTDRAKGTSKMNTGIIKEALFGVVSMKIRSWFRKYNRQVNS